MKKVRINLMLLPEVKDTYKLACKAKGKWMTTDLVNHIEQRNEEYLKSNNK